ncbi:jg24149, partial [Pararge aegeria aegeria]
DNVNKVSCFLRFKFESGGRRNCNGRAQCAQVGDARVCVYVRVCVRVRACLLRDRSAAAERHSICPTAHNAMFIIRHVRLPRTSSRSRPAHGSHCDLTNSADSIRPEPEFS